MKNNICCHSSYIANLATDKKKALGQDAFLLMARAMGMTTAGIRLLDLYPVIGCLGKPCPVVALSLVKSIGELRRSWP
jgi:hypothetical protein